MSMSDNDIPAIFIVCVMCFLMVSVVCITTYNLASYKIAHKEKESCQTK